MAEVELQNGWQWSTLGQVARWGSGGTPKRDRAEFFGGPIPWAVIGDLNDGVVAMTANSITELGLANSAAKWIEPRTILMAMYGSIGKLGIAGVRMTTNQAIAYAVPDESLITGDYLLLFLRAARRDLIEAGKGGTQQNISQTVIKAIPIPLPPLNEQRRLVAEVERVMTVVRSAQGHVDAVRTRLDQVTRALPAKAVRGDLPAFTRPRSTSLNGN